MIQHIAIIPDGNRRWSKLHGISRLEGHQRGAEVMYQVADYLADKGIKYLTLWGFSTDNWKRQPGEVDDIFNLLEQWLDSHTAWANSKGIRLHHLGHPQELPESLREAIRQAVELTHHNTGMTLNIAVNYTGRAEILDAVARLIKINIPSEFLDEARFASCLDTRDIPDVDLVIRTAGDMRMSNFLLWQTAYSEIYFTKMLWPDFDREELDRALLAYSVRPRRLGGD